MPFIGGRRRKVEAAHVDEGGLPRWLMDYFLVGALPEHGTAEAVEFARLRYFERKMPALYLSHRAEVIREAQRLGFTRADEPAGEMFAKDEHGLPLPLPAGVVRVVEGEPSPWFASRSDPDAQAILRQRLAEARGEWGGDAA